MSILQRMFKTLGVPGLVIIGTAVAVNAQTTKPQPVSQVFDNQTKASDVKVDPRTQARIDADKFSEKNQGIGIVILSGNGKGAVDPKEFGDTVTNYFVKKHKIDPAKIGVFIAKSGGPNSTIDFYSLGISINGDGSIKNAPKFADEAADTLKNPPKAVVSAEAGATAPKLD